MSLDYLKENLENAGYAVGKPYTFKAASSTVTGWRMQLCRPDGQLISGKDDKEWNQIIGATCGFGYYVLPEVTDKENIVAVRLFDIKEVLAYSRTLVEFVDKVAGNYWVMQSDDSAHGYHIDLKDEVGRLTSLDHSINDLGKPHWFKKLGKPGELWSEYIEHRERVYGLYLDMLDSALFTAEELKSGASLLKR